MTLEELKTNIINNTLSDDLLIFKLEDNSFLSEQYIDEICAVKKVAKNKIQHLSELFSSLSLVFKYNEHLNVLYTDVLSEVDADLNLVKNTVIVCKKIDKKLEFITKPFVVVFPKLSDWCIRDYMDVLCPKVDIKYKDALFNNSKKSIYKIKNELSKLQTLDTETQNMALANLLEEDESLYHINMFNDYTTKETGLIDLIIKKDKIALKDFLMHKFRLTFDPIAIVNSLLLTVKKALLLCYNSGVMPEDLGIKSGQVYFLKKDFNNYPFNKLCEMFYFLSDIDLRLKSNLLDMDKKDLIDYVICEVL